MTTATLKKHRNWLWAFVGAIYLVPFFIARDAQAAGYLKIDGVDGESQHEKHKNEIDILSWSWGVSQPLSGSGSLRQRKPIEIKEVLISKPIDKSSPKLAEAAAGSGKVFPKVEIHLDLGKDAGQYLRYKMEDVLISSYQITPGSTRDAVPTESVSLNFTKIEMEYVIPASSTGEEEVVGTSIQVPDVPPPTP